ncbi:MULTISPECIES: ATP-binding protein [Rhodococcus]|uniref:ATP-binding protein n=1 Tax=Rhodococcus TaxID=1827 RepID=UPI0015B93ECD|nr:MULTISPECIES: ATP-binding protein [Rhodococcus]MCZ4546196.1 ATP-binding protein [Rhodococcus qingshengii]UGQ53343.1 ATP-binding protein [Rhodococcus qingshengii]
MNYSDPSSRRFEITVLGRTLEHLGTQMYKRRDVAIAELVANAWDAGATNVELTIPTKSSYDRDVSTVVILDNGIGMTADQVEDEYLVIGRNRRSAGQSSPIGRRVMGRKGVGKLAGFGLGRKMVVETWRDEKYTRFELDGAKLKADGGEVRTLGIEGVVKEVPISEKSESGTRVTMRMLKHKTPPDIDGLHRSLARRFSRSVVGEMKISINGEILREPDIEFVYRLPVSGEQIEKLPSGDSVRWWAGFSDKVLPSELQGFTVIVNGKTAQAPPYFFGVEGTASGQHGTKYLSGVMEADFLDSGDDDESDRISTDRQEIDWEDEATLELKSWGDQLTRKLLRERLSRRENETEKTVTSDPRLKGRLDSLDSPSKAQATKFIRALGNAEVNPERINSLADTILQAFEYRQFHDYISELETASEDPEQFGKTVAYIQGWKVLESRAILEVVKGRIEIIEKFFAMIVNNASETAHVRGNDNMHDLLASYPWLINPEWQVLSEEKTISKQLEEWNLSEVSNGKGRDSTRYDFLALNGDGQLVVIEIKRSGHDATLDDLHQLEGYVNKLSVGQSNIIGVFIASDNYSMMDRVLESWKNRDDIDLLTWSQVHKRTASHYYHYKSILDSDLNTDSFDRKVREVSLTRSVLATSSYRDKDARASGMGPQDSSFDF